MLLDIMSPYNHIPVNVKAIQIFGLPCATYWAVLSDIYPRVVLKNYDELMSNSGYFTVDREYIQKRISLTVEEQLVCDQGLVRVGVLAVDAADANKISISLDRMFEILAESDANLIEKIRKQAKTKKTDEAAAKRTGTIATLCAYSASLSHTPEVQEAYSLWITAMVESKKARISKPVIQLFHETMSAYTSDPAVQVEILREAAASGYTNASWVINSYTKNRTASGARLHTQQKVFAGVDETTSF